MPPRERQKLQPRTLDVLGNVSDRYYREGNVEGMRRVGQEMQDRLQNSPTLRPGTGSIFPGEKRGEQNPYSFWNVSLPQQTGDNSRIMTANNQKSNAKKWLDTYNIYDEPENNSGIMGMYKKTAGFSDIENYSPDGQGTWMTESPWGQKVLSGLVNKFASEGSSEYLQDAIGGGGIPLWGGNIRPTWEDDNYGLMWSRGG